MITAVILTNNENSKLLQCLESLLWCQEIIVTSDSEKNEKTLNLIKRKGVKVYKNDLKKNFSQQRNFALERVSNNWALFIDADEIVSSKLKNEILGVFHNINMDKKYNGFVFKRQDFFLGRWLKYGEASSVKLLRLGKKNTGKWKGKVHEVWDIKGRVGEFKNPIIHKRNITISNFLTRINIYSSLRADELYQKKIKANFVTLFVYPIGKFIQNYSLKLGALDGFPGFTLAFFMSLHSFLVRAKLYLLWKNES
ncbi:glycosyltransferase family 2 protein [Patescibacteria group bacterium]